MPATTDLPVRFPAPLSLDAAFRLMMLDPTVANLNTGSFGPLSQPVFDRATELRRRLAEEPMDFLMRQLPPLLWNARSRLATYLGTEPHRLIFAANVSAAINYVANGLALAAPGEILLSNLEYGAMHWCWERAAQRQGLSIRTFTLPRPPCEPQQVVDAFVAAASPRTRLLFFSHVLSPTGMALPARELCREARRRGILTVIDGAHAPAMIPLAIDDLQCDFYAGNCHKWLLAPTGSGFLALGNEAEDRLLPTQVSWGYHVDRSRADEPDDFGSTPRTRAFEFEGTRDLCPWLAVPTAIDFQAAIGWEPIHERIAELVRHVRGRFAEKFPCLSPATPDHPDMHGSLTAYWLPEGTPPRLQQLLWEEERIEVPIVERAEGRLVRVSTHFYNTEEEVDRLIAALGRHLK